MLTITMIKTVTMMIMMIKDDDKDYDDAGTNSLEETFSLSGHLTSPNYPGSYVSGTVGCAQHDVTVPRGFRIEFRILDLDLQCCRNYKGWRDDLIQFIDNDGTVLLQQDKGSLRIK